MQHYDTACAPHVKLWTTQELHAVPIPRESSEPSSSASVLEHIPSPSITTRRSRARISSTEACLAALLETHSSGFEYENCMDSIPPMRAAHNRATDAKHWARFDLRINVPLHSIMPHDSTKHTHDAPGNGTEAHSTQAMPVLTNPSVLCYQGRLMLAARAIWPVMIQPPCTDVWRSHTIFTTIVYDRATNALIPDPRIGHAGQSACVADLTYATSAAFGDLGSAQAEECARNGLPSSVGLGTEDPRLLILEGLGTAGRAVSPGSGMNATWSGTRSPAIFLSVNGARAQRQLDCTTIASHRTMLLQQLQPLRAPVSLRWGGSSDPTDRNWILFEHAGKVHASFSVQPHVVLQLGHNGDCVEVARTSNPIFLRRFPKRAVHGGANPMLITSSSGSPFYYVSVFHTKDESLRYENYAYTFEKQPPFRILSVARQPLRLHGSRVRFVSSLTALGSQQSEELILGISYGADDVEARMAILPLSELLKEMQDVSNLAQTINHGISGATQLRLPFEARDDTSLMSRHGAGGIAQHMRSAEVRDGPGKCFLLPNTRFDSPSIKVVEAPRPSDCCSICLHTEYCNAFSWAFKKGESQGRCWLKQWSGTAVYQEGSVSAHFSREATCGCDVVENARFNSTTISVHATAKSQKCCAKCLALAECGAWSWAPARGGTCELKTTPSDGLASLHSVDGVQSALVALKRTVMFVHHHPPHAQLGCDRRLLALLQQIKRGGWDPIFAGNEDYDPGPVRGRTRLSELGIPVLAPVQSNQALVAFARNYDVSVVVITLWFWGKTTLPSRFLRTLRTSLPHVKIVIMSDDVHHLRLQLMADEAAKRESAREVAIALKQVEQTKEDELKQYFYADHVLTISEQDKQGILASLVHGRAMHEARFTSIRHVYDDGILFPMHQRAPFAKRNGLLFVGNVNNPTNLHGLRWFVTSVWPLLRRVEPTITLRVVGSWDGDEAKKAQLPELLKSTQGVETTGYVDDLGALLQQARVFVVPITWATGVITKQSLAHVHGLPTVATHIAAKHAAPAPLDGDGVGSVWSHALGRYEEAKVAAVAATPEDFAAAVLHIYRNNTAWEELSANGARFARSGGGGKGVCPSGIAEDWRSFWQKLQTAQCGTPSL